MLDGSPREHGSIEETDLAPPKEVSSVGIDGEDAASLVANKKSGARVHGSKGQRRSQWIFRAVVPTFATGCPIQRVDVTASGCNKYSVISDYRLGPGRRCFG